MYAQVTVLHCPMGQMTALRRMVEEDYLPAVCEFDGFISAYFMQRIDDPDMGELVQFWDNQAAVENLHRTGMMKASLASIVARLPGLRIQRQGYIVNAMVDDKSRV